MLFPTLTSEQCIVTQSVTVDECEQNATDGFSLLTIEYFIKFSRRGMSDEFCSYTHL